MELIEWSPDVTTADYLEAARAYARTNKPRLLPFESQLVRTVAQDIEYDSQVVSWLLDPTLHVVDRPAITILAYQNQAKNLTVRWRPASNDKPSFRPDFIRECMARSEPISGARPFDELLWVHEFQSLITRAPDRPHDVQRLLLFATRACYEQIVRRLASALDVCKSTRFVFRTDADPTIAELDD